MTETSCVATITPNRRYGPCKLGSCGVPVSLSEIKIVDEDGNALPQGQEGELWIRGPHIMQGYHNNETATKEILTEDRWLKTGDVACVDEEGHLYIVDRKKELIKVKGLQVSPTELENVLRKMDGIADLAIIGVPDERAGELPRAFVVRAPNSNIKESDVEHFLETRVAPFKKLSGGVKFINEIPKTPSGKILRKTLREIK
jgi:4-coumarate--CoA ligase